MKQKEHNELKVITLSKRLCKHTVNKVNNLNHFPKKYRFSLVNPIQDDARNILRNLVKANYLNSNNKEQMKQRLSYQLEAICCCDLLLLNIETALDEGCIDDKSCEYWSRLIVEVKKMAISWRNSDIQKYSTLK